MISIRDPARIPKVLGMLKEIWEKNPDMRLGQLILNVFSLHNGVDASVYYMEDEDFIKSVRDFYDELGRSE